MLRASCLICKFMPCEVRLLPQREAGRPPGPARYAPARAAAKIGLHGCRAETSRCGSANNSCALTGVRSRENRIKRRRKTPGQTTWMEDIKENSDGFDCAALNESMVSVSSCCHRFWSFVCAPFIHHLCFLGNRGLPAGTNTSS